MKKYDAIARDLSVLIDGKQPGEKIPSEQELAAQYAVSPMTVRRAVQELIASGRIEGIPGRGTFVRHASVLRPLSSTSFSETMRASGRVPTSRLVTASIAAATEEERSDLELEARGLVIHLERVRCGDGVPLCYERATLSATRFPGLLGHDLEKSLYTTLRTRYDTVISRARFEVDAALPDPVAAEHLGIPRGTPCLRARNISRDQHGTVVERATSLYRGDMYTLTIETGPSGTEPGVDLQPRLADAQAPDTTTPSADGAGVATWRS